MRLWWLLLVLMGSPLSAWAAGFAVEVPGRIVNLSDLTDEAKRDVPSLEGLEQEGTRITFRKRHGETFSSAEQAKLEAAVSRHDATAKSTAQTQLRRELAAKLKVLGLTEAEIRLLVSP